MIALLDHGCLRFTDLLSEPANTAIETRERRRSYQDGQLILAEGDSDQRLLIIHSGSVKVGRVSADGCESIFSIFGPGQSIGLIAMIEGRDHKVNATAVGKTVIGHIDKSDVFSLMDLHPEIINAALSVTVSRLAEALDFIENKRKLPLEVFTAVTLLKNLKDSNESYVIRWNQSNLALVVGVSRVSIGKVLKNLERKGLIHQKYGSIEVRDPTALAAWIDDAKAK